MPYKISEREQKIIDYKKSGKSYREISKLIGISSSRVQQIFKKTTCKIKANEEFKTNKDFYSALELCSDSHVLATRTFNCLFRAGCIRHIDTDIHELDKYSDEDLMRIRNFGKQSLKLAREANELYKSWHDA